MPNDHAFFSAMECPNAVTWTDDIHGNRVTPGGMFTPLDIAHMKTKGIDLSSYDSVKINAVPIYNAVSAPNMPPAGSGEQPWSTAWVAIFGCWIQQGCPL